METLQEGAEPAEKVARGAREDRQQQRSADNHRKFSELLRPRTAVTPGDHLGRRTEILRILRAPLGNSPDLSEPWFASGPL